MADELKTIKFQLMLSEGEAREIDDWGFQNRIRSRAEAMRRLCQIGLVFDNNRAEILERFRAILEEAAEFIKLINGKDASAFTELEKALIRQSIKSYRAALDSVVVIRTTTGVANNFKVDREIETIIDDTKALFAQDGSATVSAGLEALSKFLDADNL